MTTELRAYLTPELQASARAIFRPALPHTYTRTPVTEGATRDLWTRVVLTPEVPVAGVRCRFIPKVFLNTTDGGLVVAQSPPSEGGTVASIQSLTIEADDPLKEGDLVSDVYDADGRLLLAGPADVTAVLPHAGLGGQTLRMAILRGDLVELPPPTYETPPVASANLAGAGHVRRAD